jgi:hypothetical protein
MFPRTQKRKAISTVLTTLIILVASVVLGTGVVLYGTSLFQTGAQSQAISTTGTKLWVDSTNSSGYGWGAADVRNSGDKLLSLDKISIRGQDIPFSNWYADRSTARITTANFQAALINPGLVSAANPLMVNQTSGATNNCPSSIPGPIVLNLAGGASAQVVCLTQQSGPISLQPGDKVIVYFKTPQNLLTAVDAGSAASVALYAGQVGSPVTVTIASK